MSMYVLHGLRPWLIQRISAVYILIYVVYLAFSIASASNIDFQSWRVWLFHPFNTIAAGLFVLALLMHAWIGIRDIILDYVHNTLARMTAFTLVIIVLAGSGLWCAKILLLSVRAY
ncbi:MAG: succinate dehydrogenase, hydrophobic membrane anchor protein [Gammaproteobacteria bacterium]|nr:succinate dehydrogenase, hydrophobic membrane anchor protein [Gammaproteobacteria bacterium]NNJ96391.1 succinate dehydrogenase, hydrophobic membrane anchor protein [Gammaproteobacteria bacterium]